MGIQSLFYKLAVEEQKEFSEETLNHFRQNRASYSVVDSKGELIEIENLRISEFSTFLFVEVYLTNGEILSSKDIDPRLSQLNSNILLYVIKNYRESSGVSQVTLFFLNNKYYTTRYIDKYKLQLQEGYKLIDGSSQYKMYTRKIGEASEGSIKKVFKNIAPLVIFIALILILRIITSLMIMRTHSVQLGILSIFVPLINIYYVYEDWDTFKLVATIEAYLILLFVVASHLI